MERQEIYGGQYTSSALPAGVKGFFIGAHYHVLHNTNPHEVEIQLESPDFIPVHHSVASVLVLKSGECAIEVLVAKGASMFSSLMKYIIAEDEKAVSEISLPPCVTSTPA